jgi:hypothetical protein
VLLGALAAVLAPSAAWVPAAALAGALAGGFLAGVTAAERSEAGPVARVVHDSVQEVERALDESGAPPLPHVVEEPKGQEEEEEGSGKAAAAAAPAAAAARARLTRLSAARHGKAA